MLIQCKIMVNKSNFFLIQSIIDGGSIIKQSFNSNQFTSYEKMPLNQCLFAVDGNAKIKVAMLNVVCWNLILIPCLMLVYYDVDLSAETFLKVKYFDVKYSSTNIDSI